MDRAIYLEVLSRNLEILIEELVLRRCQASIETSIEVFVESLEEEILKRRNNTR